MLTAILEIIVKKKIQKFNKKKNQRKFSQNQEIATDRQNSVIGGCIIFQD